MSIHNISTEIKVFITRDISAVFIFPWRGPPNNCETELTFSFALSSRIFHFKFLLMLYFHHPSLLSLYFYRCTHFNLTLRPLSHLTLPHVHYSTPSSPLTPSVSTPLSFTPSPPHLCLSLHHSHRISLTSHPLRTLSPIYPEHSLNFPSHNVSHTSPSPTFPHLSFTRAPPPLL